jgi:hypothetical protein
MYDGGDEQQSTSSNKVIRRVSKRTTASFNEHHQTSKGPIYTRPSFAFSNPLRRLNSKNNTYFFYIFRFFYSSGLLRSTDKTVKIYKKKFLFFYKKK